MIEAGFSRVVALGEFRPAFDALSGTANGTRVTSVARPADAVKALASELTGDEVVLVKASRGERLERVVDGLAEQFGVGD